MAYSDATIGERHMEIVKNQEFHRDPTQKLNQNKNFYYKNLHMEIKKKIKVLRRFKLQDVRRRRRRRRKKAYPD